MTLVGDRDGTMGWWVDQTSRSSAAVVVPLVAAIVKPTSVLDVGCGNGAWLQAFTEAGILDIQGLDGPGVDSSTLLIPRDRFKGVDLGQPPDLARRYDLVCCLEVAEHLPRSAAPTLVAFLARSASTAVLFSAAVPGQGGAGHLNEQWPDFWHGLFRGHGYVGVDAIRPQIWDDSRVAFWYRQNAFLFVPEEQAARFAGGAGSLPLRAIHPELFERANRKPRLETYTPRQLFWALRRSLWTAWLAQAGRGSDSPAGPTRG